VVEVVDVRLEARAHAELRRDRVGELVVLHDVAPDADDRRGSREDDAGLIEALQGDDVNSHGSPFDQIRRR
jgi:hypothetical protein